MSVPRTKTLTVSIERPPGEVYRFVSDPRNFPTWVTSFCRSVRRAGDEWIVETTQAPVKLRFAAKNDLGVLDHYVTVAAGREILVPMRVIPNASGSEVLFTLFRLPEMSDDEYARDLGMVEADLRTLKDVLERKA